jgi:hypothetical protein
LSLPKTKQERDMTHETRELNINELDAVTGGFEGPAVGSKTPDTGPGSGLFWSIVGGVGSAAGAALGAAGAGLGAALGAVAGR